MRPHWFESGGEAKRRTTRYDENGRLRERIDEWVCSAAESSQKRDWLITDGEGKKSESRFRDGMVRTVLVGSLIHGAVFWAALYTIVFAPHWTLMFLVYAIAALAMGWVWLLPHTLVWVLGGPLLAFDHPMSIILPLLIAAWLDPGKWAYTQD